MSRKIRADNSKRVSSTGYQQMQDLEVAGSLRGPAMTEMAAAIAKVSAISTTPVKLAAPVAEGTFRSITLRWSKQYNLANFSRYELQVSDDEVKWYELCVDGSRWDGNLNEVTSCKVEYFSHANVPLVLADGDLVGKTLYYRVRQVTLSEVTSAWSETAHATTKPVADLVLTDSYNRYIEISSHKGIYADDRQGHIIHDIPNAPILENAYPMGHYYAFKQNDAVYTLLDTASATHNVWQTGLSVQTAGCTNIKGVKLRTYIYGTRTDNAQASAYAIIYYRPTGSTWASTTTSMTPCDYILIVQNTYTLMDVITRISVLDVPVGTNNQIDYLFNVLPNQTDRLVIQQMGIWV